MKSFRVCLIAHGSGHGGPQGAEKSLIEFVDVLKEHGVLIYLMVPSFGPLTQELDKRNVIYCKMPFKRWADDNPNLWRRTKILLWNLFISIPMALKLIEWKCNLVITNTIIMCAGAFSAKLLRIPHIWYIREYGLLHHHLNFHLGEKLSFKLMDYLSDYCICNSKTVYNYFKKFIREDKLIVVHQAVNINKLLPKVNKFIGAGTVMNCIIIGAVESGKGQEDAIRAISELKNRGIKCNLLIIGRFNTEYGNYIRQLVVIKKLKREIKFTGYIDNPFPFLQKSDVFLMCSQYEAFGRVTIEAMKAGIPVVGARSGGTIELISEWYNGLLYSPFNYKELANKLEYLYKNPNLLRRMGENAQEFSNKNFNQTRYREAVYSVLDKLD